MTNRNIANKEIFGSKFLVSCQHAPINIRFKKAQQLTVSNAFPANLVLRMSTFFRDWFI
jgi:hypothetical protein